MQLFCLAKLALFGVLDRLFCAVRNDPRNVSNFDLANLPNTEFYPDVDGELFARVGGGIAFYKVSAISVRLKPRGPGKEWMSKAEMGKLFEYGQLGVMIGTKCAGEFVKWFGSLAVDIVFPSTA